MADSYPVRAAVMTAANAPLELLEYPVPEVGADEVLVRITHATLCGSDFHTWRGRRSGPTPAILGHEGVGVVERLGARRQADAAGQPLRVGDRVTWTLHSSCGECDYCTRHGLPMKCRRLKKFGHDCCAEPPHLVGALAEACLLDRGTAVLRLPESLDSLAAAPANCAAATAVAVFEAAGDRLRSVLVQGAGALGVYAAAYAATHGCEAVVVSDVSPERLEVVRSFGATHTIGVDGVSNEDVVAQVRDAVGDDGVDAVLGFTGAPSAAQSGLDSLRVGGVFVEAGCVFPDAVTPIDLNQLVAKRLTVRGVHNYALEHLQRAIGFLAETDDRFDWRRVVGRVFPLDAVNDAFAAAEEKTDLRVAVRMGDD